MKRNCTQLCSAGGVEQGLLWSCSGSEAERPRSSAGSQGLSGTLQGLGKVNWTCRVSWRGVREGFALLHPFLSQGRRHSAPMLALATRICKLWPLLAPASHCSQGSHV